jgi:hypothetical protein
LIIWQQEVEQIHHLCTLLIVCLGIHMNTRKRTSQQTNDDQTERSKTENVKETEKEKPINLKSQKHSKEPQKNLGGESAKEKTHTQVALIVVDVINDLEFEGLLKIV